MARTKRPRCHHGVRLHECIECAPSRLFVDAPRLTVPAPPARGLTETEMRFARAKIGAVNERLVGKAQKDKAAEEARRRQSRGRR
jgi:hypothetical protein